MVLNYDNIRFCELPCGIFSHADIEMAGVYYNVIKITVTVKKTTRWNISTLLNLWYVRHAASEIHPMHNIIICYNMHTNSVFIESPSLAINNSFKPRFDDYIDQAMRQFINEV